MDKDLNDRQTELLASSIGKHRQRQHRLPRLRAPQDWGIATVAVFGAVALHFKNFRSPLLGVASFREAETAYPARQFARHGIDLLHPHLPIFGPPWQVPFEFPAFQAIASIPMRLGISSDASMHLTALACFALSGLLLFGCVRYVSTRVAAFGALIAFAFSPFALVWGSAGLIEYLATACALAFLWAGLAWRDTRRPALAIVAVFAGALGAAIKLPSEIFWGVPFVLYRSIGEEPGFRQWLRTRLSPRVWAIALIPLVVGVAWTRHADAIKNASPATRWLTTSNLTDFNFGTLEQRGHVANWQIIGGRIEDFILGPYVWIGVIALAIAFTKKRELWIGLALAAVLPIAVFFNLYVVHDYYLIAVTPALAALAGLGTEFLWRNAVRRAPKAVVAVVLSLLWIVPTYWVSSDYWQMWAFHPKTEIPSAATAINQIVPPNGRVVVQGFDWDPVTLYYAERRGLYLKENIVTLEVAAFLRKHGFHYWYAGDPSSSDNDLLRTWSWVGSTGPQSYRMSSAPNNGVETAQFIGTNDARAIDIATSQGRKLGAPIVLVCDGPSSLVPNGGPATWLMLSGADRPGLRFSVGPGLAPLPSFSALVLRGGAAGFGSPKSVACTGGGTVTITPIASGDPTTS